MEENTKIAILILAAGSSSRMGKYTKQLLPWKDSSLIEHAVLQANTSIATATFVILGYENELIQTKTDLTETTTLYNAQWSTGMGSSITTGIDHITKSKKSYDAVLIMLVDQPFMDTIYLNRMMHKWIENPEKIITTQYKNRSGVPAIFGKKYFHQLQQLHQDFGAKELISCNLNSIIALPPGGKEIDIDTWETYQKLSKIS